MSLTEVQLGMVRRAVPAAKRSVRRRHRKPKRALYHLRSARFTRGDGAALRPYHDCLGTQIPNICLKLAGKSSLLPRAKTDCVRTTTCCTPATTCCAGATTRCAGATTRCGHAHARCHGTTSHCGGATTSCVRLLDQIPSATARIVLKPPASTARWFN